MFTRLFYFILDKSLWRCIIVVTINKRRRLLIHPVKYPYRNEIIKTVSKVPPVKESQSFVPETKRRRFLIKISKTGDKDNAIVNR